jgi:Alginate export
MRQSTLPPPSALVRACAAALALSTPQIAAAQESAESAKLKISGSVRLRAETIDGQPRAGFNASDDLFNLRTRVLGEYDAGGVRFGAEFYDSRVDLEEAGTPVSTNEVNTAELVQAYVAADIDAPWSGRTSLQAGRFTLNLGSRRLVAADEYRNTTNGYTGLRADLRGARGASATLIYVLPQVRLPDDVVDVRAGRTQFDREDDDLQLFGGVYTRPALAEKTILQATYFGLRERDHNDEQTRDRELDTIGLRAYREPAAGAFDFDLEGFAQSGSISANATPNAARLDVSAWFAHAELGWRWDAPWRPRLAAAIDTASGDEPGGDYQRFDTLYGMRRGELAPSGLYNAVGRANVLAPGLRIEVAPNARLDAFFAWRGLWLAEATDAFSTSGVRDASGASGDFAGSQFDARLRYWLAPERLRVEANLVYLDKGGFLRSAPNVSSSEDAVYTALDLTVLF